MLDNRQLEDKEEYNNIPVYYCRSCLSLKIKSLDLETSLDYCEDCGSTEIEETNIEEWERLYQQKYGIKYLNKGVKYGRY